MEQNKWTDHVVDFVDRGKAEVLVEDPLVGERLAAGEGGAGLEPLSERRLGLK